MKKKQISTMKSLMLRCMIYLSFFYLFSSLSCKREEDVLNQLPELTDPIPFNALGGGTIVFKRIGPFPGDYEGCYVIDVEHKETWSLSFPLATNYCVSPDGKRIAFTMYSNSKTLYDIYVVNVKGTGLKKLTDLEGQDRFPSWSPDGGKFLVNIPEGDYLSHLYLLNSDGSNLTQVTFAEGVTDQCVSWGR